MPSLRPLILASASPRRVELLRILEPSFSQQPADIDETQRHGEDPKTYVCRMAEEKAAAVAPGNPGSVIIGADTTVVIDGQTLGKPKDRADGIAMLQRLGGRTHQVLTGVCVLHDAGKQTICDQSEVSFVNVSSAQAAAYWATGEPADKAGGYGIQGLGSIFVQRINGSYSGVMGLPLAPLTKLLRVAGATRW